MEDTTIGERIVTYLQCCSSHTSPTGIPGRVPGYENCGQTGRERNTHNERGQRGVFDSKLTLCVPLAAKRITQKHRQQEGNTAGSCRVLPRIPSYFVHVRLANTCIVLDSAQDSRADDARGQAFSAAKSRSGGAKQWSLVIRYIFPGRITLQLDEQSVGIPPYLTYPTPGGTADMVLFLLSGPAMMMEAGHTLLLAHVRCHREEVYIRV